MPPPERILPILRRAATLARATPGRSGFLARLQDCTEVLAAGDLHGHVANFQAVHKAADLSRHPARHLRCPAVAHPKPAAVTATHTYSCTYEKRIAGVL